MEHSSCKASQFYVVHFIEKPFEGIDYYVCVPYTWILHRYEENKNLLVVAYPTNENPLVTRKRVQKKEERQGGISGWQFCKAKLEYPSDTYKDAERWISQKKNLRPLVQDNSKPTQNKPWDYELRYGYQKYFSDSQDKSARVGTPNQVPRKQLPNAKDKKSLEKEKKKHFLGQLERNETAKSTVQNTSAEPVSSTTDQSITIGDKQPVENTATNNSPNTEDSTRIKKQNNHINSEKVLIIDLNEDSKANIEDHSHQEQHSETRNQNQLAAPKSPSSVEQTPQNQHYDRRLRIKDIQNLTALFNNQELRVNNILNERPPTFQHNMSSSASNSAEFCNQNQNSTKNMPIRPQNVLIPVELTKQLPRPLNQDLRDNDVSNENTFTFQHNMASLLSNTAELRNQNQNSAKNMPIRPQNVLIPADLTKQLPKPLNQDLRVNNMSNERPPIFQHNMSSSASNSAEFWNQNQNSAKNMSIRPQDILIPVDITKQLPKPLNQDLRVNNISNERPPTFQHNMSSSASNSAEFWNQNQNSTKNMPIRRQNVLIPVHLTQQLPKPLNQDLRVNYISNERPPTFQHNMSSSASNSAELWNQNQNNRRNMPIRKQNALIPVDPTKPNHYENPFQPLNQEIRFNNVSNERLFTGQHHMLSSLSMSAELLNQNQNSRRNVPIRPKNDSIPVDLIKHLPKPLTKSLTAKKARQGTSLLITNINCTRVESMGINSQDIQHVAAMIPVPATSRGVASVTSPKSLEVNHEQLGFVPQIVQQNLPYPQEQKQTREQDLDQRQPVFCENRFAPRRLESHPSEVTQHQTFRPFFNNVLTNIPSQLYQPLDIQHREQRVVSHENAQQRPAIILRKNNRRSPNLQGVKKITPPPALPRAPKSITRVLVNSLKNDRWNEPELQEILNAILKHQTSSGVINALPSISSSAHTNHYPHNPEPMGSSYKSSSEPPPVYENFDQNLRLQTQVLQSDGTNSTRKRFHFQDKVEKATKQTIEESECPTNLDMEEPLSLPYGTASGSGIDTDHEAVSGSKMLVDEALEAANEIDQTENNSMDRSRNSLSELALQQQMVEKMSTACMTLNSSLKSATNMFDNFRDSFLKIAKSLQTSSDNNQRFDTLENSAYHAPSSSNVKQEIPPVVKRRQISAPERRNSSNRNLQKGDNVNKASARIYKKNSRKYPRYGLRFVLPSEYDPNNTNWTLKYQEGMSGVVELMPKSKIYVKLKELKRCERVSTSCELLAQLMLHEVFNEKALGVCAPITETARARSKSSPDARPPLDNHGSLVLLNYVIQYAIDSDWNLNLRNILKTLDIEMRKIQLNGLKSRLELDDCKLFQNRLKKLV